MSEQERERERHSERASRERKLVKRYDCNVEAMEVGGRGVGMREGGS